MKGYKVLKIQEYTFQEYKLIPIRFEDRFAIMQWRNEQIYHLRQNKPLTIEDQENYFNCVVQNIFNEDRPNQILFSFLKENTCIGYGGLVHINWEDRNAEISFIMKTSLEQQSFDENWRNYLNLIEKVAFNQLSLHKIYTYAFDVRPHLYRALEASDYKLEAILKEQGQILNEFKDVIIHSKFGFEFVKASLEHIEITYQWASNETVRKYSFNTKPIQFEEHKSWFLNSINSPNVDYYLFTLNKRPIGSFKVNMTSCDIGLISFLIDPDYQGKGYGKTIIRCGIQFLKNINTRIKRLNAEVLIENTASIKVFENIGFQRVDFQKHILFNYEMTQCK